MLGQITHSAWFNFVSEFESVNAYFFSNSDSGFKTIAIFLFFSSISNFSCLS